MTIKVSHPNPRHREKGPIKMHVTCPRKATWRRPTAARIPRRHVKKNAKVPLKTCRALECTMHFLHGLYSIQRWLQSRLFEHAQFFRGRNFSTAGYPDHPKRWSSSVRNIVFDSRIFYSHSHSAVGTVNQYTCICYGSWNPGNTLL